MSLTPAMEKVYAEASRPFWDSGGAISERHAKMRPWRVFLEINSACNLRCPTCTKGNTGTGYEHVSGFMEEDLMERCLDKIKSENPEAIVFLYGNSEPWLHPRLPECIAAVKARGLRCELSTNLNRIPRVEEVLAARPDFMIISLSGFTQEIYERGHQGGDIEKVKANMRVLAKANERFKVEIHVNYHLYNDNEHELAPMTALCKEIGLGIFTSTARAISMENAIQYCREHDPHATAFAIQKNRPDWNTALPPVTQQWRDTMQRLKIPPDKAREMYARYPRSGICPVGAGGMFVFIRHDGKTELCACVADRRITLGDYLDTTPDELIRQRLGHAICQQCSKYRLNLYFHIVNRELWD
jgi:MoaA/NifB/PqqE/SkfB family radical SAM enzyme